MSNLIQLILLFFLSFLSYINSCKWSPTQCGCSKTTPATNNRIVGGVPAVPHSWPWTVSVRLFGYHICGGTLINNRHVLSAAHCFEKYKPSYYLGDYTFAMGHHLTQEAVFVSSAKRIIIHDSYDFNGRYIHDIALIELNRIIDFNNGDLGFACLPFKHANNSGTYPSSGTNTWTVGWGTIKFNGTVATELRQVSVPITNNKGCQSQVTSSTTQICAGYDEGGKDSCQGDSGGPLLLDLGQRTYELIGIVSFGSGCAEAGRPGIYTRVTGYIGWINNLMKETQPSTSTKMSSKPGTSTKILSKPGTSAKKPSQPQALLSSHTNYQQLSFLLILIEFLFLC